MESLFREWASSTVQEEQDVDMDNESTIEYELADLKRHVNNIRPLIASNPWLQSVITEL